MGSSKNNTANRRGSLIVNCPKCDSPMKIVKKYGDGPNGNFWDCSCGFSVRQKKGDYKDYSHKWTKK